MNYELTLGVPATPSGFPLYLCSLHLHPVPNPRPRPRSQFPVPAWLAKDAAPIPNALAAAIIKFVRTH